MNTPREILSKFYSDNHLPPDGGQSSSSVKIQLTEKFHFYFPNFKARRKAVIKHDIHHLLTGYSASSIIGESEISTWELASGCKKYWVAFLIDTSGMMLGFWINPMKLLRAFARGRRTGNLYHDLLTDEKALDTPVDDLKKMTRLDEFGMNCKPNATDVFLFLLLLFFGAIFSIASLALIPFLILYTTFIMIAGKK
ncbi:MAG: hypothetical protein HY064_15080 [Bacteroidetes bacterium]|nr:hypothetical protein [Bacteroidota bacterium]